MLSINILRKSGMLLIVLALTACSTNKSKVQSKQASLYFGAGTQSLMVQQYTEALKNLLKANELDPQNPDILNNLGMAYFFKGERDMAVRYLEEALSLDKNNSDARVNLASIYFKEGNYNNAEKLYKIVLKDLTYEKQARTYYNLGLLEIQVRKDTVAAENYFRKSIKEDDNYCPSYQHLGLLQFGRRQFNSALRNFKEASMGTCYDSPAPHYYQAMALIELRRYEEARIKLEEIDSRFKRTVFAVKAREKSLELNELENRRTSESHASRKMLDTPEF